ncbi:MAG: GNAT family N-acetyltransferase [Clostridiales Family XIII bacterium]|nr:GNAT family N-acetyltransferase [Clostridiales Family XIII bacterium]
MRGKANDMDDNKAFDIRFARPDEARRLVELLVRQHGLLYPHRHFYDAGFLAEAIAGGRLFFAVAADGSGELAGMICADERQRETDAVMGFSLLTVLPAHRGLRLGGRMQDFLDEHLPLHRCAYTCMHCLTMDTASQRDTEKRGYTPTGLLPNRYFFDRAAANLEGRIPPPKRTHLLMCKAFARKDAGALYCPEGAEDFVAAVYGGLGVAFRFAERESGGAPLSAISDFSAVQNEQQSYCEMRIERAGEDLAERLRDCARRYDGFHLQTYSALLNMTHASCPFAARVLRENGYGFTGLAPFAAPGAYAIFYRSPSLPRDDEGFALLPSFRAMLKTLK